MITTTSAFKSALADDQRQWLEYADITLKNNTILNLTNENFWNNGFQIEDAVSADSDFQIGSAIINKATLVINNIYGDYDAYDFKDATVKLYIGLTIGTTIEKLSKGVFTVNEASYDGSIITLECEDYMAKFDVAYSNSNLIYPATLDTIVRDACSICDVALNTYTFPHRTFVVQERPNDNSTTFREVISWAAQIAGCYARCSKEGKLELKWYNKEALASPETHTSSVHTIDSVYSKNVSVDDVVITGVNITLKTDSGTETRGTGTNSYVVQIADNPFITLVNVNTVLEWLGAVLIGMTFRKATVSHSSDPSIEAGDIAVIKDVLKNKTYPIVVSKTVFSVGSSQNTTSAAQTPARNSAARYSNEVKNYVKLQERILNEETDRETQYRELLSKIEESSDGLFSTIETADDGGKIYYLHNHPSLSESDVVWKMTANAWAVSTDGMETWNGGMTVDGDTITRILSAVGINAGWIDTGELSVKKENGTETLYVNVDTGTVRIVADEFSLSNGEGIQTIEEKTTEVASSIVDQIKIGGVNLLRGTNSCKVLSADNGNWSENAWRDIYGEWVSEIGYISSVSVYDSPNNNIRLGWKMYTEYYAEVGMAQDNVPVTAGREYTISCYVKGSGNLSFGYGCTKTIKKSFSIVNVKKWQRISWTFTTSTDTDYINNGKTSISFELESFDETYTLYICGMKLEYGNKMTDWSESPSYLEDYTADRIAALDDTLTQHEILRRLTNNFQKQGIYLNNNQLYINGSYIKSGSINAKYITTGIISDKKGNNVWDLDSGVMSLKLKTLKVQVKDTKTGKTSYVTVSPTSFRMISSAPLTWKAANSEMTSTGILKAKSAELTGMLQCSSYKNKKVQDSVYVESGRVGFYFEGKYVGCMGGSHYLYATPSKSDKGIQVTVDKNADHFSIVRYIASSKSYEPTFAYARTAIKGGIVKANTLNAFCNFDMHNHSILNPKWFDGKSGITGTLTFSAPTSIRSNGTVARWTPGTKLQFKNGILIMASFGSYQNG